MVSDEFLVMLILCLLQANTVYGALRGLEVMYDYDLSLEKAPAFTCICKVVIVLIHMGHFSLILTFL